MIAACGQMEAVTLDQGDAVWPVVERLAKAAADAGADLFVLPETTYPAYWLHSMERYMQPDILRSAEVLRRFSTLARTHHFYLAAGFVEERNGKLFNSAALFDRAGEVVGIARKNFLWDCDNRWFAPGDSIAAWGTELGRVGMMICADCRAPEIAATLVADGARMIILPTAWVNASKVRRTYRNVHPEFLIRARALEFGVPLVCCSKAGREGEHLEYVGQSRIVAADGRTLAEAPTGGEHLIVSEVTLGECKPTEADDKMRTRIMDRHPAYRAKTPGGKVILNVKQGADAVADALESSDARVGRIAAAELGTFVAARYHALTGAQVVVARGRAFEESFIRARAAENRVFVVAGADSVQMVVAPDGSVIFRETDWDATVELDLSLADIKQFTPETDLWAQRRVECYRLPETACVS
ncbi:MAG: carbon-nitrogen hydrolase family protein [Planctomycetota bacterium]